MKKCPLIILLTLISLSLVLTGCNSEKSNYNKGVKALESANYDKAIEHFSQAGEYEDSKEKIKECNYRKGLEALEQEDFETAIGLFSQIEDFEDAKTKLEECYYKKGIKEQDAKEYAAALESFSHTNGYEDSENRISECQHNIDVLQDKTAPVIAGLDDTIKVTCGKEFNLNDFIAEKIQIEDDVTHEITDYSITCDKVYDRGTGNIDTMEVGEYEVNISAKDEANNVGEKVVMLSLNPVEVSEKDPNPLIYDGEYATIKLKSFKHGEVWEYSDTYGYYAVFDVENKCDEPIEVYWSMYTSINDYQVNASYEITSIAPGKKGTTLTYIEDKDIPEEAGNFSKIDSIVCIKKESGDKSFFRIPTTFYTNAIQ